MVDPARDRQSPEETTSVETPTAATDEGDGETPLAFATGLSALTAVLWLTVDGLLPPSASLAALVLAVALVAGRRVGRPRTLRAGAVVAGAVLVVSVAVNPLDAFALPDIGVLGAYTYLATEVAFGTLALVLCVRADALRSAGRTVAVLYPLAYVWDWYTLEVGVFAVRLRTGVDLFGIPLEEHLFMLVVPALVVGVHETLR